MSDIQKKSKTVEDLEFLNGEIGKLAEQKQTLEDEIVSLGVIQKTRSEEYKRADNARERKFISLDNQIATKEKDLVALTEKFSETMEELKKLTDSIQGNKAVIAETLTTLSLREEKVKENEENNGKQTDTLTLAMKDIERNRKEIETIRVVLKEKEDRVSHGLEGLDKREKESHIFEEKLKTDEKELERREKLHASRVTELENEQKKFNEDKYEFIKHKEEFTAKEDELSEQKKKIEAIFEEQKEKEAELTERNRLSIIREQKSTLKDEELRIREKRISIKEQNNDLASTTT